jgi:hypothetical protein
MELMGLSTVLAEKYREASALIQRELDNLPEVTSGE